MDYHPSPAGQSYPFNPEIMQTTDSTPTKEIAYSVIIPAYREGDVIHDVIAEIRQVMDGMKKSYEILVVDDGSMDDTAEQARKAGATVIQHPYNIGNGAAVKSGMRNARGRVFVHIDADGQVDPNDIPRLLEKIGPYDMVIGARSRGSDTATYRNIANSVFNRLASYTAGRTIEDLTCGFRVIKAHIARQFIYLLPNTFSYPSTLTLSIVRAGYSLGFVPIIVKRRPGRSGSKIKPLRDGMRFLLIILKISVFFAPLKIFIPLSALIFLLGVGYGLFRVLVWHGPYGQTSALLISTAVLTFLVGLVSEQIAQLRFDRSESTAHSSRDD
jgi:glycosyltransferase involved in cell wall biosynthesis